MANRDEVAETGGGDGLRRGCYLISWIQAGAIEDEILVVSEGTAFANWTLTVRMQLFGIEELGSSLSVRVQVKFSRPHL